MSIATSKATSTTLPPPIINSLGPSQRARLLKSRRKLENLLGTIPQVVDPGNVSLHEKSKSQNVPTTTPLEPSISTADCFEHAVAASAVATQSPLSPLFPSEDEPMSPTPILQEKNMTKLMGDNISTLPHDRLKHQRSPSESSASSFWSDSGGYESEAPSLMTNDTMSTTIPSPTINSFGSSQRNHLLKSTLKLDNSLGAIPQVEESAALPPVTTNPERISFPVSSADSSDSLEQVPTSLRLPQIGYAEKHKSAHLPRPLVLRHSNMPDATKLNIIIEQPSSADSSQALSLPHTPITTPSPLSPLFASEDEPMSPAQVPQERIRRRRMAKLTRTLGENIPTEFLLPHAHLKHQRSPSEPSARSLWPDWGGKDSTATSVVASNTISTTVPPPTTNSLDPSQRARLLKSTRKLEHLLGATPQVEESAALPPATTNSGPISFPVSSEDSSKPLEPVPTSLRLSQNGPAEKHSKRKSLQHPRALVLRHNSVSAVTKLNVRIEHPPSADPGQVPTLPDTAIATPSPLFPTGDEPLSPMEVPQERIRRMRMAKLTRTLGENIPTEFLLPRDHLKHQRSPSEPSARSLWPDWGKKENEATSMVTNNTTSTTVPPPTINALDPSQRTRLLKSTRKLENLLGATPQVEESPPVPTNPRRISFPVSSQDSPKSVPTSLRLSQKGHGEQHSKHKSTHLPRPLVLRHNNVSAVTKLNVRIEQPSSVDSPPILPLPHTEITTPSPLSSLFATGDEPMSPMEVPQEKIRRMRMAKLTRTLGENIPTEFILTHDHFKLSQHQRSPSEPSPHSLWPDWSKEGEGTAALHSFSKGGPQTASVIDSDPTLTNATIVPSQRPKPTIIRRKLQRRSKTIGPEVVLPSTLFTVTSPSPERPSSPVILSDSETTDEDDVDVIVGSDWRGEWNIKDAQERAMALRNLRGH